MPNVGLNVQKMVEDVLNAAKMVTAVEIGMEIPNRECPLRMEIAHPMQFKLL